MIHPVRRECRRPRAGFTLVELMVVLGIILVLMGLLIAGVMKATTLGKRTSNMSDIQQLNSAVVNFMQQFNVKYIPSRIYLSEDLSQYHNSNATCMMNGTSYPVPAEVISESKTFLQRMFPKLVFPSYPQAAPTGYPNPTGGYVDWNGDGSYCYSGTTTNEATLLEGDQCLVFFLGGIPARASTGAPGVTGFSTNTRDPSWHVAKGGGIITPFFGFKSGRLADRTGGQGYYSYLDAYGQQPYLYFSNYGNLYGYNRYTAVSRMPTAGGLANNTSDYNVVINGTLTSYFPYAEAVQATGAYRYLKANGFQIISAGEDRQFGPGTNPTWSSLLFWNDAKGFYGSNGTVGRATDQANEDQASFSGVRLGDAGT